MRHQRWIVGAGTASSINDNDGRRQLRADGTLDTAFGDAGAMVIDFFRFSERTGGDGG